MSFLGYFAKAIVGENGPKIRHILLNLVWLGGKFPFQRTLSLACLGIRLICKSDRYELILPFFIIDFSPKKN